MHRIDTDTAVAVIPASDPVGAPGYFTKGNPGPGTPVPATNLSQDWCNAVQEEIANVVLGAGLALDKSKNDQLLSALQGPLARKRLTADTTFFIRPDGNNANTGLANTAGGAWLTLQHAFDVLIKNYDANGFQATVQCADSLAYAGASLNGLMPGQTSPIILNGNAATPANVTFTSGIINNGGWLQVQNFKVQSVADCLTCSSSLGVLNIGPGMIVGSCGAGNAQIYANNGVIVIGASYSVVGGGGAHLQAFNVGKIIGSNGVVVTLTGTPAFSVGFASLNIQSMLNVSDGGTTFVGPATGPRYVIDNLSGIFGTAANANYFPGSIAGTNNGHGSIYN